MKKIIVFVIFYVAVAALSLGGWFYLNSQVMAQNKKGDSLQKDVNAKQSERNNLADEVSSSR